MFESITHLPGPVLCATGLLIVGLHVFHLSTRRSPWPGAVVPGLWLAVLTVLVLRGQVDHWWALVQVTLVLFITWGAGRTRTSTPQDREAPRTAGNEPAAQPSGASDLTPS